MDRQREKLTSQEDILPMVVSIVSSHRTSHWLKSQPPPLIRTFYEFIQLSHDIQKRHNYRGISTSLSLYLCMHLTTYAFKNSTKKFDTWF